MPSPLRSLAPLWLALIAGGCATHPPRITPPAPAPEEAAIVIDGDTSEWPAHLAAVSDEHSLSLRFSVADEQFTLQSASRSVSVWVDCDANASTGSAIKGRDGVIGADLQVLFSPGGRPGVKLLALDSTGGSRELSASDFDLVFAPTYASSWYEVRICRTPEDKSSLPATGLLSPGRVKGFASLLDANGLVTAASDTFSVETQGTCVGGRRLTAEQPPAAPEGAMRVVTWNIEQSKPMESPAPFARVIKALKPDVVLMQEWEKGDAAEVDAWFEQHVGGSWHVRKAPGTMATGGGVLIASRFELVAGEPKTLECTFRNDANEQETKPVRFVDATLNTPLGPVQVGSMHLKSRGAKDSIEDRRRMAEARAINAAFTRDATAAAAQRRIMSGDLNLVGSRPPLDILRAGVDADGSDLTPAAAMVHGDLAYYTWKDDKTAFSPGRLDWIVYSDSNLKEHASFVLDASRLDQSVLTALGIERGDTATADHLPVVIDLVAR
ncbi:MAG: endonuclease/exonuclease/phosphatase family protein [Phycisphaerae bacterium]